MNKVNIIEFDVLHRRYSILRDAHAEGLISDLEYLAAFELVVNEIPELMDRDTSVGGNFERYSWHTQDLNMQRYEYLVHNYAIMKKVYDQTVAAYSRATDPGADK